MQQSPAQNQDMNMAIQCERNKASSSLAAAIDLGKNDIVNMLLEEGIIIHEFIDCYSPQATVAG